MASRFTQSMIPPAAVLAAVVAGCGKKEPPPAPPPPPVVRQVDPFDGLDMDPKLQFPDKVKPSTHELAEAVVALGNALAKGDAAKAEAVLDASDKAILKELVDLGDWADQTKGIQAVRVCVLIEGDDKNSCKLGLGVEDSLGAYMLAWKGSKSGPSWIFSGMAIQPLTAARVSMLDGVELAPPTIASAAKEVKILTTPKADDKSPGGGGGGGDSPGGPSNEPDPYKKPTPD